MAERSHAEPAPAPAPALARGPKAARAQDNAPLPPERRADLSVSDLQQFAGNRAVSRLLQGKPRPSTQPQNRARRVTPAVQLRSQAPERKGVGKGGARTRTASTEEAQPVSRVLDGSVQDPVFQSVMDEVHAAASAQKVHERKQAKRQEVVEAAILEPRDQQDQSAKEQRADELEGVGADQRRAGERFTADEFKVAFAALVSNRRPFPTSESKVKEFAHKPPIDEFPETLSAGITAKQAEVAKPLQEKSTAPLTGGTSTEPGKIQAPKPVAPPRPIDPKRAVAQARPDDEISRRLRKESERLDGAMEENRLTDEQLAESREPSFLETLQVKREAQQKVAEASEAYRGKESAVLGVAELGAQESLSGEFGKMSKVQTGTAGAVHGGQTRTETKTEKRQREIKGQIDAVYEATVEGVKVTLEAMTTAVTDQYTDRLTLQKEKFNERVRQRISEYYGDFRIDDKIFGPAPVVVDENTGKTSPVTVTWDQMTGKSPPQNVINPDAYRIFTQERDTFIAEMGKELDAIADIVQTHLNAALFVIQLGKSSIALIKAPLTGEELAYATQLEEEVGLKFEMLEGSIDDAREDLLQTLADQYTESLGELEKSFNDIHDELKKSWLDRAIDFIVTVGKTVFQLAELLFGILVRVAHLVWDIIAHPIRFFETLVAGLMQGVGEFISNIGTYLQEAFWSWLGGVPPATTIRLSPGSGVESLFDLVTQMLSLGRDALRAIAEKVLGKEFLEVIDKGIAAGEKAFEPVVLLLTKGPVALWEYLKDMLGSSIESTFERIKDSVFYGFIEKGLKWVAGFFVPGGGFVKIIKAIFKAFQFVAENLANIRHFFESVFDSMEAATEGNTAGVASKVVTGLKTGVVLTLDFLAKQIGLEGIVNGVQKGIRALRRPIVSAIEWVLRKVKPLVARAMRALGMGAKEDPRDKEAAPGVDAGVDVRALAFQALASELRTEHSGPETLAVIQRVAARLRPKGLRKLELVPGETEADAIVWAEASPKLPLAHLKKRAAAMPAGREVIAAVELTLKGPPTGIEEGAFASVAGHEPLGGQVLREATRPDVVQIVSWNTSPQATIHKKAGNVTHAEHQFVHWLSERPKLMSTIRKVEVSIFDYSPCGTCAAELTSLLLEIKKAQKGNLVLAEADLYWKEWYANWETMTVWHHIDALRKAGWTPHAPGAAYPPRIPEAGAPPEGDEFWRAFGQEKGGFWRVKGDPLTPFEHRQKPTEPSQKGSRRFIITVERAEPDVPRR